MPCAGISCLARPYLLVSNGTEDELEQRSAEDSMEVWSEKTSAVVSELLVAYLRPRGAKTVWVASIGNSLRTCLTTLWGYRPSVWTLIWWFVQQLVAETVIGGVWPDYDVSLSQKIYWGPQGRPHLKKKKSREVIEAGTEMSSGNVHRASVPSSEATVSLRSASTLPLQASLRRETLSSVGIVKLTPALYHIVECCALRFVQTNCPF